MPCGLFSPSSMGHTSLMRCRSRRGAWLLASVLVVLMACGPGDNMSAPRIGDSAVDASPPDAPELIHGAELVSVQVTESVGCNEELSLIVNLRNSGTSTWTDAFYVALSSMEGFEGEGRAYVDGAEVAPGAEFAFSFLLDAPATPGRRTLAAEFLGPRGGAFDIEIEASLMVLCEPPDLALSEVVWLDEDVSGWERTVRLREVVFRAEDSELCFDYMDRDRWPNADVAGVQAAANVWVFIYDADRWYGATWDWLAAGEQCKFSGSVSGEYIRRAPFDALSGWAPASGEVLYFMLSGIVRGTEIRNSLERTNPRRVSWP